MHTGTLGFKNPYQGLRRVIGVHITRVFFVHQRITSVSYINCVELILLRRLQLLQLSH